MVFVVEWWAREVKIAINGLVTILMDLYCIKLLISFKILFLKKYITL